MLDTIEQKKKKNSFFVKKIRSFVLVIIAREYYLLKGRIKTIFSPTVVLHEFIIACINSVHIISVVDVTCSKGTGPRCRDYLCLYTYVCTPNTGNGNTNLI